MTLSENIQHFLGQKLEKDDLTKKVFAKESGIPYSTLCKTLNAAQRSTELNTILKIANYFNCSLNEVTGRHDYIQNKKIDFKDVSLDEVNLSLKEFVKKKLKERSLTPYQLVQLSKGSDSSPFSDVTIYEFIDEGHKKKMLSSAIAVSLADYFKVSLDEMVGRVPPSSTRVVEEVKVIDKCG